jgi:2-oxo-4-hydroxy-4-carboxy-5-ureidoimidazoline decarboxylase
MTLEQLNSLEKDLAATELEKCCGAANWVKLMMNHFPFASTSELIDISDTIWNRYCSKNDWLEAFTHHPRIGDIESLEKKFASTKSWAGNEQSGVKEADSNILQQLLQYNDAYEQKFGFIFIVCATGKSAGEMLELLKQRIGNSYEDEINIAAAEQNKITAIRINKLLS